MTTRELLNVLTNQVTTNLNIEERDVEIEREDNPMDSKAIFTIDNKRYAVNILELIPLK